MKEDNCFWNYKLQPGLTLNKNYIKDSDAKPLVSIITSYYNSKKDMWQTINCVFNQTFQNWEWIIVDDGSTNVEDVEYLKYVEKLDKRIKVYHKENGGLAKGRDYAVERATTNYILPLDADDLIEETYIECLYWSLRTTPGAAWAFSDSVGFGKYIYLSDCIFDSERMKTENHITATALIRKEKILEMNGYGVAKRYVNEDWHLWLRMLAHNFYPVQDTFYGFWYRRQQVSLLSKINNEKNEENKLRLRDIKIEADKIKSIIKPVRYPGNYDDITEKYLWEDEITDINKEEATLVLIENTGADKELFKKLKKLSENNRLYILALETTNESKYFYRQKYERFATVYNLDSFISKKYHEDFVNYIIKTKNIKKIICDRKYEKIINNFKDKEIIEYKENEKFYKFKIRKYNFNQTILGRIIRKILRFVNIEINT